MTIRLAFKLLALVMLGMALSSCVVVIQPGEIGVVVDRLSGEVEAPLEPGSHILSVSKRITIYPTSQQELTFAEHTEDTPNSLIEAYTSDGQIVAIDLTLLYAIDPAQINLIHAHWGNTYAESFLRPITRSVVRDVTSLYAAEAIYSADRENWGATIQAELEPQFSEAGFILADLLIRDIIFSPEFTQAMELTAVAAQDANASGIATANAELENDMRTHEAQVNATLTSVAPTPTP